MHSDNNEQLPRRGLSIRQPWAELILRGVKTLECRSRPTKVRGRVQIYAGLKRERDLEEVVFQAHGFDIDSLPRGLLVGTVEIVGCRPLRPEDSPSAGFEVEDDTTDFAWVLANPIRSSKQVKPTRQPQPSFFFLD